MSRSVVKRVVAMATAMAATTVVFVTRAATARHDMLAWNDDGSSDNELWK